MSAKNALDQPPVGPPPSQAKVAAFIAKWNRAYAGKLTSQFNYPRVVSLCDFLDRVVPLSKPNPRIAVVSGSLDEPELALFPSGTSVETLCFPDVPKFDLSLDWDATYGTYDVVLCNHVLEHVPDPFKAMQNLARITTPDGLVFVGIPVVNCVHGLPYFYSAGFYPTWLQLAFHRVGLKTEFISYWGSKKFMVNAALGSWPTHDELKIGFTWPRSRYVSPLSTFVDGRPHSNDPTVISCAWGLARKPT